MSRIPQLQKLLEIDPSDADVLYMLAQEHARLGELKDAVAWYDKCLEQDATYAYAYFHKARAQEANGELDLARGTLRRGLEVARVKSDAKAAEEIEGYLSQIDG